MVYITNIFPYDNGYKYSDAYLHTFRICPEKIETRFKTTMSRPHKQVHYTTNHVHQKPF